jgi:hypothetical protein
LLTDEKAIKARALLERLQTIRYEKKGRKIGAQLHSSKEKE